MTTGPRPRIDRFLSVLNTVLTATLLVGLYIAYEELQSDHEARRRAQTVHLYEVWREVLDAGTTRDTLELIRDSAMTGADLGRIAAGKARDVVLDDGSSLSRDDVERMRRDIIRVLNMFEQVALTAHDSIGDPARIRSLFNDAIRKNYELLQDFIKEWTKNQRRSGWGLLDQVLTEWNPPPKDRGKEPL